MILPQCFTRDWILQHKTRLKTADPQILEKCIHALALLGHLAETGLPFVFKGGTSLLLHLPEIRRLSIDIDIVCDAPPGEINRALQTVSGLLPFSGFSEDARGERGLPKRRHFKFNYSPIFGGSVAPNILLDIVEDCCTLATVQKPVTTAFLETSGITNVKTLSAESLIADKLTAFAPHTSGVPYENTHGVKQWLQVAKQMFDIGELFNVVSDTAAIIAAYDASITTESGYRGNGFSRDDALSDTIETCFQFCGHELKQFPADVDIVSLAAGCKALQNHLVNYRFGALIEAKVAAAKAACLATIILKNGTVDISSFRYSPVRITTLKHQDLSGRWAPLRRLKSANPEAFYYWTMVQDIAG